MKLIISLIDLIVMHEGKKTLRFIEKESLKEKANEETLLRILNDNKNTVYGNKYGFKDIHSLLWVLQLLYLRHSFLNAPKFAPKCTNYFRWYFFVNFNNLIINNKLC